MSAPTPTGLAALQPRPMTAAQVRALVQRVRRIDAESKAMRDAALVSQGNRNRMACTRGRVAARYARLVGCSLSEARDTLVELTGAPMSLTQVCEAWRRIYPRVSARAQRRKSSRGRKAGRTMMGWRAWLAFETKPGITRAQPPGTEHIWRELAKNCRAVDGKLDVAEFERWMDCIIERSHAWGEA